ncbi:LysR family transcriptional regulator [Kerstersia similis]|uniref:LysR family transcriptional regulator n=1 Tax=Kerstersia similis TaxID=206505 RepID=UPI0039EE70F5
MDIRALRYFIETVKRASFTQAAEALYVTQSTISKMVRQLEEEIGAPLLIREARGVHTTDVGQIVYERGQEILAGMRRITLEVQETTGLTRGALTVGIPPMVNLLFTPVVQRFRERYPAIELQLREATGQGVERLVASGELEVGATILPADHPELISQAFGDYPLWVVGPARSPLRGRKTLAFEQLAELPLLMLDEDFALTRRLRQAFRSAGFTPKVATHSAHWDFLVSMASAGLGYAVLPDPLIRRLKTTDMCLMRLVKPDLKWQVGHIWPRERYISHAARAWLEVCAEVMQDRPGPAPETEPI